jgi:hypothetical protein
LTGGAADEIGPLPYVTPSRVSALEACFLRAAFDADPHRADVFRGPKARLGAASHALLERVMKRELDGVPAGTRRHRLQQLWEEEAQKEGDAARSSELERHLGPPRRWPGYNIQRARVLAMAQRLLERREEGFTAKRGSSARAERFYSAYGGRLRGRADAVYSRGGRTVIEDYKTGAIHDEVPGAGLALKPRLRKQLLLYAAMHHDETGQWPASGCIVPLVGPKETFRIDPTEAEHEARAALALMDAYNERASTPGLRQEWLATPAPDACRFCSHKLSCEAFWLQVSPEWDWPGGKAIRGTVLRLETEGRGSWRGEVEAMGGTLENGVYGITGSRRVPLEEGQQFRATGLKTVERQESLALVVADYTVVQRT